MLRVFLRWFLACLLALSTWGPAQAATPEQTAQATWRLLDYIAVDYREAVADGRIKNQLEYDEMGEFSATAAANLAMLPERPRRDRLIAQAKALQAAIAAKSPPEQVAAQAKDLAAKLLAAYPVPLVPSALPDLARGAKLYAESCASCHGAKGEGPAPQMAPMDPPPIAFADRARARDRSLFGL